ncbi:MAG: hypothetical protein LUC17_02655, partial [Oscillospiraceae bacterium]|nr:hypothetical protein [Oscillospiraceae bacterium]
MASKSLGTVGKANLNIVPKFDNLGATIKRQLDGVDTSSSGAAGGSAYGESFTVGMGSMLGGGAIAGVMASITSEVTSILSDAVMSAVQRSDILASFPKQMANLGFSTNEATASIETMSDRLTGLPTSLSDMASVVTGIAAITGDL